MNKYEGYLIVSDLDGTLINSSQNISKQNIGAISSYIQEGGLFAVATGRTEINVLPYINKIDINCPCILYNGAIIYDINKKSYIKSTFLNKLHLIEPLKQLLNENINLCMQIFIPGKMFIVSSPNNTDPIVEKEGQPYEFAYIDDIANENWVKIMMTDTNKSLNAVQRFLMEKIPSETIHSVFSSPTYLEIFAYGVSKGSALYNLINITGIKKEKVIAIGDYCNDIEMIKEAGLGVATANAHPLLKNAANIVTVSNDEHAIYSLINKILPVYSSKSNEDRITQLSDGKNECTKIPV
jgi:Cof subfamily protein (haloacid dehalogenase superfamily)